MSRFLFVFLCCYFAPVASFTLEEEGSEGITVPSYSCFEWKGLTKEYVPFLAEHWVTDVTYDHPLDHFHFTNYLYVPPFGKFILVDNRSQRLWAFEDGEIVAYFIVSTGRSYLPTRPGDYRIGRKLRHGISRLHVEEGQNRWWGMDYYMDLNWLGGGFHALPVLWNRFPETIDHLGTPVSHRCVRLGNVPIKTLGNKSPAQWLFDWTEEGDNPFTEEVEGYGTPVKVIGVYRSATRIEVDHSPYREFSPEKGFYLEEPLVTELLDR